MLRRNKLRIHVWPVTGHTEGTVKRPPHSRLTPVERAMDTLSKLIFVVLSAGIAVALLENVALLRSLASV